MTNVSRLMSVVAGPLLLIGRISAQTAISDSPSFDQRRPHSNKKSHRRSLPLRGTPMIFRGLTVPIMLAVAATGCTRYGVSGPEDLGLAARFNPQTLPTMLDPDDPDKKLTRNQ